MAITIDDFAKVWASQSPLTPYEFSESNYKEGWNFIGVTPPSRQMWDSIQKQNDEKLKFVVDNFLPLDGGTMTGAITTSAVNFIKRNNNTSVIRFFGGTNDTDGAWLKLSGKSDVGEPGWFTLMAHNGTDGIKLRGLPNGVLMWGTNNVLHAGNYNSYALPLSGGTITGNLAISGIVTAGVGLPPVGSVTAFAGSTTPQGWLLCDGSAVSRTGYADLYAVIGDTYGAGDGSTTFNLPNLTDKFIEGSATSGTVKSAGLPNITGEFPLELANQNATASGSFDFAYKGNPERGWSAGSFTWAGININASRSSSIYGNSTTVQPPAVTMRYIIKY